MIKFTDAAQIGTVKRTSEGYVIARARALRTGIQLYHRSELGLMGDGIVRVMRPEVSVKDANSLISMAHAPITIGHPAEMVTADNWKDLAVGEVSTKAQWDGEFIALDLILKDKAAIDAIDSGTVELSAGYTAEMTSCDDGSCDFIMGPPSYNHLAIVDKARAGSKARIGDSAQNWGATPLTIKRDDMTEIVKVMVGDKAVSVAASDADKFKAIMDAHAAEVAELKNELAAVKIEAADAARLVKSDEDIAKLVDAAVLERAAVADKARALVADYDVTGKDAMTMRREVIAKVYGDEAVADLVSDAEIKAAFAVARSVAKADPVLDAMKDAKPVVKDNGQAAYEARLNNAWKGK